MWLWLPREHRPSHYNFVRRVRHDATPREYRQLRILAIHVSTIHSHHGNGTPTISACHNSFGSGRWSCSQDHSLLVSANRNRCIYPSSGNVIKLQLCIRARPWGFGVEIFAISCRLHIERIFPSKSSFCYIIQFYNDLTTSCHSCRGVGWRFPVDVTEAGLTWKDPFN